MINDGIIVIVRNDYYELKVNQQKNRAYLTLLGYWDDNTAVAGLIEDVRTGIQKLSYGFTFLVDMIHYNGSSAELHHLHVDAQRAAVEAGVSRSAEIFNRNPVLKSFSEIYSKQTGAATMAFQDKVHAEKWLDLY